MKSNLYYLVIGISLCLFLQQCNTVSNSDSSEEVIEDKTTPELIAPSNDATNQATVVELSWERMKGAKDYRIQIAKSSNFDSPVTDVKIEATTYSASDLDVETTYFWRVYPFKKNHEGPWSEEWQFSTGTEDSPTFSVELYAPSDGEEVSTTSPLFNWSSVENAIYHYQLSRNQDFTDLVRDSVLESDSVKVHDLTNDTQYHWRVSPVLDSGTGVWSSANSFSVKTGTTVTPPVSLVSPSDGATDQPTTTTLRWEAISTINNYQVQLSTGNAFTSTVTDDTTDGTFYDISGLNNEQLYYWRVQAVGDENESNWSAVYSFETEAGATNENGSVAGDRQALVDLYNATNGSNWKNNSGWLQGDPSNSWHGVEVNANGRVVRVDLSDNNLRGTNGLPNSLGNLKEMTYFNVMYNTISGPLPEKLFSQCSSLAYLYLNFSDDVMPRDPDLHVQTTTGGGDIHTGKNDQGAGNKFTGEIPNSTNLPNLEWFALSWTEITYVSDAIFNSTKLKGLWLANNPGLGGNNKRVPSTIGNILDLEQLALNQSQTSANAWGGELPANMSNLTKLRSLRLSKNNFTGAFPDLSAATEMQTFVIDFTGFTSGFPSYGLNENVWGNINSFIVSFTEFNDAILPDDAPWTIRTINVPDAGISSSLSVDLFSDQVIVTDFSYNNLSGKTPANLRNLKRIRNLRWSENDLSGQWPDLDWTNKQNLTNSAGTVVHPLRNFTRAHFNNNRYVFADMLVVSDNGKTLFEWYQQEADVSFRYGNQKPFGGSENLSGGIIDFSSIVTHSDNVYRWYRNGNQISGEASSVINTADYGSGTYKLEVTNPNVPGLTLESVNINL